MKDFFVHQFARRLTLPLIVAVCVLIGGISPALAAKPARVEIGFVGTQPFSDPILKTPIPFQNVLLNVVAVRINPHVGAAPNNPQWQKIPAPPGFGANGTGAELNIDLNASQNIPQLFNTAGVRVSTYKIAQLVLDSSNPGSLIPNCPGQGGDGCISYPMQLANGNSITVSDTNGLFTTASGVLSPLILQLRCRSISSLRRLVAHTRLKSRWSQFPIRCSALSPEK